jgi:hypothetical protein
MSVNTLSLKAPLKGRRATRERTRIYGTVKFLGQSVQGRVVDLSASGLALDLSAPFAAGSGSKVAIESEELGALEGIVKWNRSGRLGIEFHANSNASAQVSSYFRFFHKPVKPVLAR